MKYSAKRKILLENLQNMTSHPSAEEIGVICKKNNISAPTVYRNMAQLEEEGVVMRICTPFGKERYDGDTSYHNHIICPICGKITDVPMSKKMLDLLKEEEGENGYIRSNVVFYRKCEGCKEPVAKYNL